MDLSDEENDIVDVSTDLFDDIADMDFKEEDEHSESTPVSSRNPVPAVSQSREIVVSAVKAADIASTTDNGMASALGLNEIPLCQSNTDLQEIRRSTDNSYSDFTREKGIEECKNLFRTDENVEHADDVVEGLPKKRYKVYKSNHEGSQVDDLAEECVSPDFKSVLESSVDPMYDDTADTALDSPSKLSPTRERVNTDLSEATNTQKRKLQTGVQIENIDATGTEKRDTDSDYDSLEGKQEALSEFDTPGQSSTDFQNLTCPFCSLNGSSLPLLEFHIETMHSEIGLMNDSNAEESFSLPQDDLFISSSDKKLCGFTSSPADVDVFQFVCPFCDLDLADEMTLTLHISAAHEEEDVKSGSVNISCALCDFSCSTETDMRNHMKSHSHDATYYGISVGDVSSSLVASPTTDPPPNEMVCPVCGISMIDADLLTSHVESHFNPQHSFGSNSKFAGVVKIGNKENVPLESDGKGKKLSKSEAKTQASCSQNSITPSTSKEKVNFFSRVENVSKPNGFKTAGTESKEKSSASGSQENVRSARSSSEDISYKKQYEQNLEKAVMKGTLSVADYHEQKRLMSLRDFNKDVDDGQTRVQGLIARLEKLFQSQARPGQTVRLCSPTDHFSASYGDKGWGCGYRNFQMILSCLIRDPVYARRVFPDGRESIPSIPKIQEMIESAWQKGFDPQGRRQLGGRLVNTRKWIGATEIVATLSSLGIKCRLADFHSPTGPDGTHPRLLEWVADYFTHSRQQPLAPLYLQHQGHSRTVVGVENDRGTTKLLLFDPGTSSDHMGTLARGPLSWKQMRTFRRTLAGFKSKQYQVVSVEGLLTAAEYQESKILKSDRVS